MRKALFLRKCSNEEEYFNTITDNNFLGNELEFEIVVTIVLNSDEYDYFKNNFLVDDKNIKKVTNDLYIDKNGIVHCAYVTDGSYSGYLVYPSGYNYARYVAFHHEEIKYLKGEKNV